MRKNILFLSLSLAASLFLTSCDSASEKYTSYQCPMKCEGAKAYDKTGNCPVCHMELEGIK
jgi:protein SCO1